jgi:DNA polymerase (family 10)
MVAQKDNLTQLPGIGKELAAKIVEILETGTARALEKLQANYPQTLRNLLKIPGLGPKRVGILFQDLGIHSMAQLIEAARTGKISSLSGFGTRTERQILQTAESFVQKKRRFKIAEVKPHADRLTAYLETVPGINQVIVAGSYRRAKETVGDLDILVTARKGSPVMDRFVKYDDVEKVLSQGRTRSSVVLRTGLQVDLRLVKSVSFGAALQYFTGSQAHNIAIRRIGRQKGLKINEYGVFTFEKSVAGKTEASVYKSRGEIEAARDGNLPKLVKLTDIKGDLHIHTDYTDGQNSLREMALAARKRGLKYIAVTEHSDRLKAAGGADPPDLLAQMEEIDRLNEELDGIEIVKGLEVEILPDGRLDLPDSVLSRLDLVVGTIHNQLDLSLEKQTRRILHGMDHPHFTFFAHPFGRLINEREPIQVDMMRIIRKARERGCYLELNANIRRLDLYDTYCKIAREEGVLIAINSDAHNIAALDHMQYGVGQARRGWLEKKDVLNTRPLKELRKLLKQTM